MNTAEEIFRAAIKRIANEIGACPTRVSISYRLDPHGDFGGPHPWRVFVEADPKQQGEDLWLISGHGENLTEAGADALAAYWHGVERENFRPFRIKAD